MQGEKDDSNCTERTTDTVVDGDSTFPENDIENDSQGYKVSITREENEFDNDTTTVKPQSELEHVSNRRQSLSKMYLDAPSLEEIKFIAHKSTPIPIKDDGGGFDVFFAATLPTNDKDDGDVLLMECGDCFNDYIFMVCIQASKDTDLLFLFVNKSWLDKCPPESEPLTDENKTLEVPILDVDEWMLLTRQQVVSGSCFPTLRTDALLGKSPRKFLFMKLLYRTIFSSDLKVQVEGMFVDHDLFLRPIVDLTTKSDDNSNSNDNDNDNNNISTTGDGYDDDDDAAAPASAVYVNDSDDANKKAASITKSVADCDFYKGRSKGSRGSERQQTALKQIQAFSTSSGSSTRNSMALSKSAAAVVKTPAAKAKLLAAAKTKQPSPKRKPPPSLPPQQSSKKGTTTKGSNQVVVAAAGTGRGGKAQRSSGGSIPIVSTAEKMLQDEMKETAKEVRREKEEWKREKEDAKREREQAKREREQLKREREEFEKAQKQPPPQRKLDTHVDDVDYEDIPPAVKRGGRKTLNNGAGGRLLDLDMSRNDCTTTSTTPQHHNGYTTMPHHSMQSNNNEQQPTAQMQQHVFVQQQMMQQQQPMMQQQSMQQQQPMMMQQPMMRPEHPFIPPGGMCQNPRAMQLDPNYMAFVGTSYMAMCMAYSNQNQR